MLTRILSAIARGLLLAALFLGPVSALAVTLTGSSPTFTQREVLSSTTDWVAYVAPTWARQCDALNEGAGGVGTLLVGLGQTVNTGTVSAANDEYRSIPYGGYYKWPISAGEPASPNTAARTVMLASTTASLVVSIACYETPQ